MAEVPTKENLQEAQTYIDFVKDNLEPLATHLKVSVEWLWNILVMQARVEAVVYLVLMICSTITSIVLIRYGFKMWRHYSDKEHDYLDNPIPSFAIVGIIGFVIGSMIFSSSNLTTVVTGLLNPEFRAIEKIVEFAKPKVDEVTDKTTS